MHTTRVHRLVRRAAKAADRITCRRRLWPFERHVERSAPWVDGLRARGHDNPNVLALVLAESFYRPRWARVVEYAYWAAATAVGRPSVERLSVGRAQIQLLHWRSLGLLDDTRFSVASLRRVRDLETNYLACGRFLARGGMLAEPEPAALATFYSGPSSHHELIAVALSATSAASRSPSAPA